MARWGAVVTLNSADISASVIGTVNIEAEASTSRIAKFTFAPSGVIDPNTWIGAPVTIDYVDDVDGAPTVTRLFTGDVNRPKYDPVTRLVLMECTDNIQGHFEQMTEAQILTAIAGGLYSETVFGPREDGWQQALDVLSTVPKDYDLNRDGVTGVLTDWAAGAPNFSYDSDTGVLDYPVSLEIARYRDLVNRVTIDYECRFTRLHHREHSFGWNWQNTFCEYYLASHTLPTREMMESAASSASWGIQGGISYDTLPASDTYDCNGPVVWIISDENLKSLIINAAWTGVRRWSQTISEHYSLVVEDPGSIAAFGLSLDEDGVGFEQDYDDTAYDSSTDTDTPAWPINAIGDYTEDQLTRADSDAVIETMLQIAAVKILDTHRRNYVSAKVLIEPTLERAHTVQLTAGSVAGTGKVFKYVHELNFQTGGATTDITIAISRGSAGLSDPLTAPVPPDTQPTHAIPPNNTVFPTRIGNDDTVPDYDETWTGYTGNLTAAFGFPTVDQVYPERMRLVTPAIESESRNAVEAEATIGLTYNVGTPNEALVINA